jgi:hypothetical protein
MVYKVAIQTRSVNNIPALNIQHLNLNTKTIPALNPQHLTLNTIPSALPLR